MNEYVWYASYGSNLLRERFLCYIQGGQPEGTNKIYSGCTDKALPIDDEEFYINSELYFAKESDSWNKGGVGFIRTTFDPGTQTLARMYLITQAQLTDVIRQETNNPNALSIDFNTVILGGSLIFKKYSWYGNMIYLGNQNEHPIFTFTNENDIQPINRPDVNYLKLIIKGMDETFHYNIPGIVDYLISKQGVVGNYTSAQLIDICNDAHQ